MLTYPVESSIPVHARDYQEQLSRKARARTTPLEPDWLLARHLVASVRHASEAYASGRLLDVGCGGRPYEAVFRPHVEQYTGVDTPASTLSRPDAAALASQLPFADGSFDTILCTEVLEHLSSPHACIEEFARVLRPGGHLILTTPQMWHLHEEPYDFFRFTRFGLAHLCRTAGLEVVEIRPHGGAWATLGLVCIMHVGSYARYVCHRVSGSLASGRGRPAASSGDWQRWVWPFRLPILMFNLVFAVLDALPHPGIYTVNNMVIARKQVKPCQ